MVSERRELIHAAAFSGADEVKRRRAILVHPQRMTSIHPQRMISILPQRKPNNPIATQSSRSIPQRIPNLEQSAAAVRAIAIVVPQWKGGAPSIPINSQRITISPDGNLANVLDSRSAIFKDRSLSFPKKNQLGWCRNQLRSELLVGFLVQLPIGQAEKQSRLSLRFKQYYFENRKFRLFFDFQNVLSFYCGRIRKLFSKSKKRVSYHQMVKMVEMLMIRIAIMHLWLVMMFLAVNLLQSLKSGNPSNLASTSFGKAIEGIRHADCVEISEQSLHTPTVCRNALVSLNPRNAGLDTKNGVEEVSILIPLHIEGSIISGLKDLFSAYIRFIERALISGPEAGEGDSRINVAESLVQNLSLVANLSTLEQILSNMIQSVFIGFYHLKFEIDSYVMFIHDTCAQIRSNFFKQFVFKLSPSEGEWGNIPACCTGGQEDSKIHDLEPSISYQEFYLELRRLKKHAEDHFLDLDWLTDILKELMEAIFLWISREEIWEISKEPLSDQDCGNFTQLNLDLYFLVEIVGMGWMFFR